tara:strand:+ start:805 stop:1581 length:777 start_codon:yes stop_codon:yes gene_type:complete
MSFWKESIELLCKGSPPPGRVKMTRSERKVVRRTPPGGKVQLESVHKPVTVVASKPPRDPGLSERQRKKAGIKTPDVSVSTERPSAATTRSDLAAMPGKTNPTLSTIKERRPFRTPLELFGELGRPSKAKPAETSMFSDLQPSTHSRDFMKKRKSALADRENTYRARRSDTIASFNKTGNLSTRAKLMGSYYEKLSPKEQQEVRSSYKQKYIDRTMAGKTGIPGLYGRFQDKKAFKKMSPFYLNADVESYLRFKESIK